MFFSYELSYYSNPDSKHQYACNKENINNRNNYDCMKYDVSLHILNYAHILLKSLKVFAVFLKKIHLGASSEMFAMAVSIARRDTSLICSLEKRNKLPLQYHFKY